MLEECCLAHTPLVSTYVPYMVPTELGGVYRLKLNKNYTMGASHIGYLYSFPI